MKILFVITGLNFAAFRRFSILFVCLYPGLHVHGAVYLLEMVRADRRGPCHLVRLPQQHDRGQQGAPGRSRGHHVRPLPPLYPEGENQQQPHFGRYYHLSLCSGRYLDSMCCAY